MVFTTRFEVENVYAKSLNKLSAKLTKAVSSSSGFVYYWFSFINFLCLAITTLLFFSCNLCVAYL